VAIRHVLRVSAANSALSRSRRVWRARLFPFRRQKPDTAAKTMSKVPCVLLLLLAVALCSALSAAAVPDEVFDVSENELQVDGFGNEEVKESNLSEYHAKILLFHYWLWKGRFDVLC